MQQSPRRRWLRFSVRTLLIAITLASVWLGIRVKHVRELDAAVAKLERAGLWVFTMTPGAGQSHVRPKEFWRRLLTRESNLWWQVILDERAKHPSIDDGVIRDLMPAIKRLPHVQVLDLSGTAIGPETLRQISSMPHLESLRLRHTQMTDDDIQHLANVSPLKHLDLRNTQVTLPGVDRLKRKLPNCKVQIERTSIRLNRDAGPKTSYLATPGLRPTRSGRIATVPTKPHSKNIIRFERAE